MYELCLSEKQMNFDNLSTNRPYFIHHLYTVKDTGITAPSLMKATYQQK